MKGVSIAGVLLCRVFAVEGFRVIRVKGLEFSLRGTKKMHRYTWEHVWIARV